MPTAPARQPQPSTAAGRVPVDARSRDDVAMLVKALLTLNPD